MAKFYGIIGFSENKETRPGIWEEEVTERKYYGDILQFSRKWESGEHLNDNLNINNKISIVADPFACQNFQTMRFIEWMDTKWKITNIEIQYPRLILTIGGIYNERQN